MAPAVINSPDVESLDHLLEQALLPNSDKKEEDCAVSTQEQDAPRSRSPSGEPASTPQKSHHSEGSNDEGNVASPVKALPKSQSPTDGGKVSQTNSSPPRSTPVKEQSRCVTAAVCKCLLGQVHSSGGIMLFLGPSLRPGEKSPSLLKRRKSARSLGVLHVGGGLALFGVSGRGPSPAKEATGPGLALQPGKGGRVPRTHAGGGGPSPQTEASGPGAVPLGGGKGQGRGTEAGAPDPVPQIAGAGLAPGVAAGGRCFGVVPSTGETGGRESRATLRFSFSVNSGAPDPGHGEAQARLLRGSPNWVKYFPPRLAVIVND